MCVGLLRAHYTPLQRYMGYLCTRKAQYAPSRRKMHHGAQGRLYFLKNSGDPDDFLFWWFTEYVWKIGGAKGALIRLRVAHKEHTSVCVTSRLSPYVCLSLHQSPQVSGNTDGWVEGGTDRRTDTTKSIIWLLRLLQLPWLQLVKNGVDSNLDFNSRVGIAHLC